MSIDERIAGYTDKELAALNDNVRRLAQSGTAQQKAEAERLMPLVDAQLAERKARAPVRKAPAGKAVKPKKASV